MIESQTQNIRKLIRKKNSETILKMSVDDNDCNKSLHNHKFTTMGFWCYSIRCQDLAPTKKNQQQIKINTKLKIKLKKN